MTYRMAGTAALVLAASLSLSARPADAQSDTERLLRTVADANRDDLARLSAGAPLVRTVGSDDRSELTLVYAVRVRAPVEFVLEKARSQHLLVDDVIDERSRGTFGDPPSLQDAARLTLDRREIRDLQRCREGDCGLKLEAESIARLHRDVDWSDRGAVHDAADRFYRGELVAILSAYMARGDRGAPVYADKETPLAVATGFDRLLTDAEFLIVLDPDLYSHLRSYPSVGAGIDDSFTWTVEDLGTKSVVSINHVASKADGPRGAALIGVKRLYANHYLHAGLRILHMAPATGDPSDPDTFVTVITRYRFDGELGGIRRTAMERRLELNAETVLAAVRDRLEAWYAQEEQ